MSPPALLLRCLLIVTLCLDGSLSLWTASATAVTRAQHATAAAGGRAAPALVGEAAVDCADEGTGQDRPAHEDCDCSPGSCSCPCIFSVAAITHAVPFLARHSFAMKPATWSPPHLPLTTRTPVFRPPIG